MEAIRLSWSLIWTTEVLSGTEAHMGRPLSVVRRFLKTIGHRMVDWVSLVLSADGYFWE